MSQDSSNNKMSVSDVGERVMKYWPAMLILATVIAGGAVTNYRVQQNEKQIAQTQKLIEILAEKLEARETDKSQWQAIRSLVEDSKETETRLKAIEQHITPESIQRWGQIQSIVIEDHNVLVEHLKEHWRQ